MIVEIGQKLKCKRCGHQWIARREDVRSCAKCRTIYFDRPKNGEVEKKPKRKLLVKKTTTKKFTRRLLGGK